MRTSVYLQKASNLFLENRLLKFVIVVLAVAVLGNSMLTLRAVTYQRVVLIPPTMTGTVEFVQGRPTDRYIRDITRQIIHLSTTYSPANARAQFDELLKFYAPESYPAASTTWYALAGRVEEAQVSSAFYLEHIRLVKDNIIEVTGVSRQFASDTPLETASKTYVLLYRIDDGRFSLVSLSEKNGEWQEKEEKS